MPAVLSSARFTGCMEGIMFNGKVVGPWNFAEARSVKGCDERSVDDVTRHVTLSVSLTHYHWC